MAMELAGGTVAWKVIGDQSQAPIATKLALGLGGLAVGIAGLFVSIGLGAGGAYAAALGAAAISGFALGASGSTGVRL